jgi:phage FluMu protein Com
MAMTAKCPHCEKHLNSIRIDDITLNAFPGVDRKGVVYTCPMCFKVLSVEINPLAVRDEIVGQIKGN